jgi:hypothetical protein
MKSNIVICQTICIPVFGIHDIHDIPPRSSDDEKPKGDRTTAWADGLSLASTILVFTFRKRHSSEGCKHSVI